MSFLDRFFTPTYEKELKRVTPLVQTINGYEETLATLSNEELKAKTQTFKDQLNDGTLLDDLLPEAFAVVREASKRTLMMRHYDVQLIGGMLLHHGCITEMRTGEGKTLVGTLPAYLNALNGGGVHVVTVNDYLSRRDAVWMGQIYDALGLSVGILNHQTSYRYDPTADQDRERDEHGSYKVVEAYLTPCSRPEAYAADITYGTNNEFGFDYLRDNIEFEQENIRQRGHVYAIVDEIDSILIDEARTPLIISAPTEQSENLYTRFAQIANALQKETHFTIDEKLNSIELTDAGIEAAEAALGLKNIYTDAGIKYVHHLETAVKAKALYARDKEYVVRDNEVVIVDEFTGRLQPGRRWSDGLHQALEAKEAVTIQQESRTYASVTYQNYFRQYHKLAGMTGTALTSQEEFYSVYNLEVVPVPTNKPIVRRDQNDLIYQTEAGKFDAVVTKVKAVNQTGQPILIGTASIEKNEALSQALTQAGVTHQMLNAKNHEREGEIIADAGRKNAVTLATNMAGRGVDIKLGGPEATASEANEVRELGGLFVLGTERHEARRIDNQLRGRSGRQGDPGETQFFVSMEDTLMRVFGGDRIKSLMGTFRIPENQPIENRMITRQLESAQTRIEGFNFDARKQVLAYDDVLNKQRQVIYHRRGRLLVGDEEEVDAVVNELTTHYPETVAALAAKEVEFGREQWLTLLQKLVLQITDTIWVEHLEVMQYTRLSVGLRAYGQLNPLNEYRKEGKRLFTELQASVLARLAEAIPHVQPRVIEAEAKAQKAQTAQAQEQGGSSDASTPSRQPSRQRTAVTTPGRNDFVTITNGTKTETLKYKKAEARLASGTWQLVRA